MLLPFVITVALTLFLLHQFASVQVMLAGSPDQLEWPSCMLSQLHAEDVFSQAPVLGSNVLLQGWG